jgi:hypothetical protein
MQHTSKLRRFVIALGVAALAAACSDSGDGGTRFDGFVLNLIDQTSDTTEPVAIEGRNFVFSENPAAFDALFQ